MDQKKAISILLIISIIASLLVSPAVPNTAQAYTSPVVGEAGKIQLTDNITITKRGYTTTINGKPNTFVAYKGAYEIYSNGVASQKKIVVESGEVNITIKNLNLDMSGYTSGQGDHIPIHIQKNSICHLFIEGDNKLVATLNMAAISVDSTASLTIGGTGTLFAASKNGAAIGGNVNAANGEITVNGGTITTDSMNGAGIGSGADAGSTGAITINGGTIKSNFYYGDGERAGAMIGGGRASSGGNIIINGGTIENGATDSTEISFSGAVIGGGKNGNSGNITVNDGNIKLHSALQYSLTSGDSGNFQKNFSCFDSGSDITVKVNGGDNYTLLKDTVNVTGINYHSGTNSSKDYSNGSQYDSLQVLWLSAQIRFELNIMIPRSGAGIGSGENGKANNIIIRNGNISAVSNDLKPLKYGSNKFINTESWCSYGAFIGSGKNGSSENIFIFGGIIKCKYVYSSETGTDIKYLRKEGKDTTFNYFLLYQGALSIYNPKYKSYENFDYNWMMESKGISSWYVGFGSGTYYAYCHDHTKDTGVNIPKGWMEYGDFYFPSEETEINNMGNFLTGVNAHILMMGDSTSDVLNYNLLTTYKESGNPSAKEINKEIETEKTKLRTDVTAVVGNGYGSGNQTLSNLEINGGTIITDGIVGTANGTGSIKRPGGEVLNSNNEYVPSQIKPAAQNQSSLYKTTVTLSGILDNESVMVKLPYEFESSTNADGKLILWLPVGSHQVEVIANGCRYYGTVVVTASSSNTAILQTYGTVDLTCQTIHIYENSYEIESDQVDNFNERYMVIGKTTNNSVNVLEGNHTLTFTNVETDKKNVLNIKGNSKVSVAFEGYNKLDISKKANVPVVNVEKGSTLKVEKENGCYIDSFNSGAKVINSAGEAIYLTKFATPFLEKTVELELTDSDGNIIKEEIKTTEQGYLSKLLKPGEYHVTLTQEMTVFTGIFEVKTNHTNLVQTGNLDACLSILDGSIEVSTSPGMFGDITTITQGATVLEHSGNGSIKITGEGTETNNTISVTAGINNITIENINILRKDDVSPISIEAGATANIEITGDNYCINEGTAAGIHVPTGAGLYLYGDGTLTVKGGTGAAGIGGNSGESCGDITLDNIQATIKGDENAKDIGNGEGAGNTGGNIIINGGTVDAEDINSGTTDGQGNVISRVKIKTDLKNATIIVSWEGNNGTVVTTDKDGYFSLFIPEGIDRIYIEYMDKKYQFDYADGVLSNGIVLPPEILAISNATQVPTGGTLDISVSAKASVATNTLIFAWYKDGELIDGQTTNNLVIENCPPEVAGIYTCLVTESNGFYVESEGIEVTVGQAEQVIGGTKNWNVKINDALIVLDNTAKTELSYTLESSTNDCITLKNGVVTINSNGTARIRVDAVETEMYKAATDYIEIVVNKNDAPTITVENVIAAYSKQEVEVNASVENDVTYKVEYKKAEETDDCYQEAAPVNVGSYTARITTTDTDYDTAVSTANITINPKEIEIAGIRVKDKAYDGTNIAFLEYDNLIGVYEGDEVTAVMPTDYRYSQKDVGTDISVTCINAANILEVTSGAAISKIALSGADSSNYIVTADISGELYGNILPAELRVIANNIELVAGEALKELSYRIEGFVNGETAESLAASGFATPEITSTVTENSGVGTYDIIVSGGNASGNYTFFYVNGIYTIKKAEQTIPGGGASDVIFPTPEDTTNTENTEETKKESVDILEVITYQGMVEGDTNTDSNEEKVVNIKTWYTSTGVMQVKENVDYKLSYTGVDDWEEELDFSEKIFAATPSNTTIGVSTAVTDPTFCFYLKNMKNGEVTKHMIENVVIDQEAPDVKVLSNVAKIKVNSEKKNTYKIYTNKTVEFHLDADYGLSGKDSIYYQVVNKGESMGDNWTKVEDDTVKLGVDFTGRVYFKFADKAGNTTTVKTKGFMLDTASPTVSVKNGKTYTKAVTLKLTDKASGIKRAVINGESIKTGTKIIEDGNYTLTVTDNAGNVRKVAFIIKKPEVKATTTTVKPVTTVNKVKVTPVIKHEKPVVQEVVTVEKVEEIPEKKVVVKANVPEGFESDINICYTGAKGESITETLTKSNNYQVEKELNNDTYTSFYVNMGEEQGKGNYKLEAPEEFIISEDSKEVDFTVIETSVAINDNAAAQEEAEQVIDAIEGELPEETKVEEINKKRELSPVGIALIVVIIALAVIAIVLVIRKKHGTEYDYEDEYEEEEGEE